MPPQEQRLRPPGVELLDGPYSLGPELLLFSDGTAPRPPVSVSVSVEGGGGGLRAVVLHSRCLHAAEVGELAGALHRESQAGVVRQVSEHLLLMGVDPQVAMWAAGQSEGSSVEQRINSALNIVYS